MTKQELSDAKTLTLYWYAATNFGQASEISKFMLAQKLDTNDPMYYPLLTAVYILYSKAFMDNHGIGRLKEDIVPQSDKGIHHELMFHRHNFYAHTDTSSTRFSGQIPLNHIRIVVAENDFHLVGTQIRARPPMLNNIIALTCKLIGALNQRMQEILSRNSKCIPNLDGEYVVNTARLDLPFVSSVSSPFVG